MMNLLKKIFHKNSVKKNICILAGGTGGHVFPAISVIINLLSYNYNIIFITDLRGYKFITLYPELMKKIRIFKVNIRYKTDPLGLLYLIRSFCKISYILFKQKAEITFGFGSYISFIGVLSAKLMFKKTIIHEQNKILGLSNKISLLFVNKCLLSFQETDGILSLFKNKCIFVGMPLREEIKNLCYKNDNRLINYQAFYKIYDVINITIIGGSQGSKILNTIIPLAISALSFNIKSKLNVFHQVRLEDIENVKNIYNNNLITATVLPFFDSIGNLLTRSHILISRAGSTLFEVCALGVPSIIIPMSNSKNNHQYKNAQYLRDNGAIYLLEEKDLSKEKICFLIEKLLQNSYILSELSMNAKKLSILDADEKISTIINKMANLSIQNFKKTNSLF